MTKRSKDKQKYAYNIGFGGPGIVQISIYSNLPIIRDNLPILPNMFGLPVRKTRDLPGGFSEDYPYGMLFESQPFIRDIVEWQKVFQHTSTLEEVITK